MLILQTKGSPHPPPYNKEQQTKPEFVSTFYSEISSKHSPPMKKLLLKFAKKTTEPEQHLNPLRLQKMFMFAEKESSGNTKQQAKPESLTFVLEILPDILLA